MVILSNPLTITRIKLDKQRRFRLPVKVHEDWEPGEYELREVKNEEGKMIIIQEVSKK